MRVSPRVIIYVCDQPEERAFMCRKATGCRFPCTSCVVDRDHSCDKSGDRAPRHDGRDGLRAIERRQHDQL